MKKIILFSGFASLLAFILLAAACSSGTQPTAANPIPGKVIKNARFHLMKSLIPAPV
jgi:hypothetical protein